MLLLSIGNSDVQIGVLHIDRKACLLIEDYLFEGVRTVKDRMKALHTLFETHLFLKGGFWRAVRCSIKGHKFTFVPAKLNIPITTLPDFVNLSAKLNRTYEHIYVCKHAPIHVHNAFAADRALVEWLRTKYSPDKFALTHQSSAFIEAALRQMKQPNQNKMFILYDQRVLHLLMLSYRKLYYYNQFAVKQQEDILRQVQRVADTIHLSVTDPVILYGSFASNAPSVLALRKHFSRVSLGARATHLSYAQAFDDIPPHRYYDLIGASLCKGFHST